MNQSMTVAGFEEWVRQVGLVASGHYLASTGQNKSTSNLLMMGVEIDPGVGKIMLIVAWRSKPSEQETVSLRAALECVGMSGLSISERIFGGNPGEQQMTRSARSLN